LQISTGTEALYRTNGPYGE